MPGIYGFDVPEIPEVASLPLPSAAGAALPIGTEDFTLGVPGFSGADVRMPNPYLTAADAAVAEPTRLGFTEKQWDWIGRLAAGVEDATVALQGKQGTALSDLLKRRRADVSEERAARTEERTQRTEERKARTEEERLGLERGREARAARTEQGQAFDAVAKGASDLAPTVMVISDPKEREAAITAFVESARARGGNRAATVAQGFLRNPEIGQMFGPLMRDLPAEGAEGIRQLAVAASFKSELGVGLEHAQRMALPTTNAILLNQMRSVSGMLRDQYKDKGGIPMEVLEAAIHTTAPRDAPGTNPQLNLLRGLGTVYGQETVTKRVRSNLADLGFAISGVAATVAEKRAELPVERDLAEARARAAKEIDLDPAIVKRQREADVERFEALESAKARIAAKAPEAGLTPQEVDRLRDDFTKASGTFVTVRDSYNRILASAKAPSAAGDLSLIYNYMKMLDPGSVVRESEFAQAAQAGSFGERIQGAVEKAISGKKLADSIRKDFVDRAKDLFDTQKQSHLGIEGEFRGLAQQRGIAPERVVIDYLGAHRKDKEKAPGGAGAPDLTGAPDPTLHPGAIIRDEKTGRRFRSDGSRWLPQ